MPADDILMQYRERRREWQSQGWRMDLDEMRRNHGRIAYAIPGPGRREMSDGWAVTPVPLRSD